jgi:isopentenyl diphosphate isomerase/L-lactate dehydrogenase-like FMN-dependent dehydrogenase
MPLAVAPTGAAGLTWYEGELEVARAAARFGVPFTLATPSLTSIERIATVEEGRNWFQLYMWRERELSHALVKRAQDAGFEALILTVDTAVSPIREYNKRNGFSSPYARHRNSQLFACLRSGSVSSTTSFSSGDKTLVYHRLPVSCLRFS